MRRLAAVIHGWCVLRSPRAQSVRERTSRVDARTVILDRAHCDAIRLAANVLEEHAGDTDDPERMTNAASELDAILVAWDAAEQASR